MAADIVLDPKALLKAKSEFYDGSGTVEGAIRAYLKAAPTEAATEIETLRAALRSFAELVPAAFDDGYEDRDEIVLRGPHGDAAVLRTSDFRAARSALKEHQP